MTKIWFFLYLLLPCVPLCVTQYLNAYQVVGAETLWSATVNAPATTVTALGNVPTLVYNCHITPSLCMNAELRGRIGAFVGNYPGGFERFGWDPDGDRSEKRRSKMCPSNWKTGTTRPRNGRPVRKAHSCPETNQPPVHPLGYTDDVPIHVDDKTFAILGRNPQTGAYERTGLVYTCDEFPPAMAVQGGEGIRPLFPSNGGTYCATQTQDCNYPELYEQAMATIEGEQDWQKHAHRFLAVSQKFHYLSVTPSLIRFVCHNDQKKSF